MNCNSERATGLDVLAADDDPIFRSLLTSKLRSLAGNVLEAADGREAWQLVGDHRLHLAVVDLEMPNLNGLTLIQCLRSHARTRHIPIIVCTSRESPQMMMKALEVGASSYLIKPINWSMFEAHIKHLLRLSREAEAAHAEIARLGAARAAQAALLTGVQAETRGRLRRLASLARNALQAGSEGAAVTALQTVAADCSAIRGTIDALAHASHMIAVDSQSTGPEVSLRDVVSAVAADIASAAREREIVIEVVGCPDAGLQANAALVADALRYVVSHALARSPHGGRIAIEATLDDRLEIAVSDEGPLLAISTCAEFSRSLDEILGQCGARGAHRDLGLVIARALLEGVGGELAVAEPVSGSILRLSAPVGPRSVSLAPYNARSSAA